MTTRSVLVTGARGTIAGKLLPGLHGNYELTLTDVRPADDKVRTMGDFHIADLGAPDRDGYRHLFKGIDSVIHCAHIGAPVTTSDESDGKFRQEFSNIQMAYNILQTSLEEGVRRVVMASSNHAADYYEPLILDGAHDYVNPLDRALSDNYYGWAKEAYEHLGFVFAVGRQTPQPLENVHIRIGGPREDDLERLEPGDLRRVRRALAVYISDRDLQQLFVKSIETEDIRDEHGVPFQIFYGISGNTHAFWSIANSRKVIDYRPQDNSERRFAGLIARHLAAAAGS